MKDENKINAKKTMVRAVHSCFDDVNRHGQQVGVAQPFFEKTINASACLSAICLSFPASAFNQILFAFGDRHTPLAPLPRLRVAMAEQGRGESQFADA